MARPKGGQRIMAMASAGQKKRAGRKRAPRVPGISSDEEGFRASELGGERWERSWERTRAKNRKMVESLRSSFQARNSSGMKFPPTE